MSMLKRPKFDLNDKELRVIVEKAYSNFKVNYVDANITSKDLFYLKKHNRYENNGYTLAKELENSCGANIDSLIVDDLDCLHLPIDKKKEEKEIKWVLENNIKPKLKKGDIVFYKNEKRTINEVRTESAKYLVGVEPGNTSHNYVINFEDIESEKL